MPIGHCKKTHIITASNGIKIGLIGFGEREWLATINSLPPDLIYRSATETAKELVPKLRQEGADIVIALTHMREPNDNKLAEQTDGIIDIILGGHDHYYSHNLINGTHVLRSGTDFKNLSYLEVRRQKDHPGRWDLVITRRDITSAIPEHPETIKLVGELTASLKTQLQKPVGYTAAPLDARFSTVRQKESNIANWVCDIMCHHYHGDCCIMASGTVRGDQIYPPGPILLKDIMDCFPFEDPVIVLRVTGRAIWDALENGVSEYPALEGRFPQVSNIRYEFHGGKPSGHRIMVATIGDEPIDMERKYVLVTRGYMGRGKDGYDSLLIEEEGGQAEVIVSEENGILISMMLRQYFLSLKVLNQWKHWDHSIHNHWSKVSHRVSVVHPTRNASRPTSPLSSRKFSLTSSMHSTGSWEHWSPSSLRERRSSVVPREDSDSDNENAEDHEAKKDVEKVDRSLHVMRKVFAKWARKAGVKGRCVDELKEDEYEVDWTKAIAPRIEGRITKVGGEPLVSS